MALDVATKAAVVAGAKSRGVDPAEALAEAERLSAGPSQTSDGGDAAPAKPVADRLLIGFLPFITVKELRTEWLGLTDSVPDENMMCGDFAAKHGGTPAPTSADGNAP